MPLHLYTLAYGNSPSTQFILQAFAKFVIPCLAKHLAQSKFPIHEKKKKNACLIGTLREDVKFLSHNCYWVMTLYQARFSILCYLIVIIRLIFHAGILRFRKVRSCAKVTWAVKEAETGLEPWSCTPYGSRKVWTAVFFMSFACGGTLTFFFFFSLVFFLDRWCWQNSRSDKHFQVPTDWSGDSHFLVFQKCQNPCPVLCYFCFSFRLRHESPCGLAQVDG